MGVPSQFVQTWETQRDALDSMADHFLRLLVATNWPDNTFPILNLAKIERSVTRPAEYRFEFSKEWEELDPSAKKDD
jgi:hypothetical protein